MFSFFYLRASPPAAGRHINGYDVLGNWESDDSVVCIMVCRCVWGCRFVELIFFGIVELEFWGIAELIFAFCGVMLVTCVAGFRISGCIFGSFLALFWHHLGLWRLIVGLGGPQR